MNSNIFQSLAKGKKMKIKKVNKKATFYIMIRNENITESGNKQKGSLTIIPARFCHKNISIE